MHIIRPAQMEVLAGVARARFEDRMVAHLRAHLPSRPGSAKIPPYDLTRGRIVYRYK